MHSRVRSALAGAAAAIAWAPLELLDTRLLRCDYSDVAVLGKLGTLGHSIIVRKGDEVVGKFAEAIRAHLEA